MDASFSSFGEVPLDQIDIVVFDGIVSSIKELFFDEDNCDPVMVGGAMHP
jgi:hypothetical protein